MYRNRSFRLINLIRESWSLILLIIYSFFFLSVLCSFPALFAQEKGWKDPKVNLSTLDLETRLDDFILETIKLEIPGFPHAFNPSIICWKGSLLVCFRSISKKNYPPYRSEIGFVWLDEELKIKGPAVLLTNQIENFVDDVVSTRAEDVRLVNIGEKLYMAYNDYRKMPRSCARCVRMHLAELEFDGANFTAHYIDRFADFEGERLNSVEKNWMPFDFEGNLLFVYSILPHQIFRPLWNGGCETFASSKSLLKWEWGELRGGTPAFKLDENRYLAFFHSVKKMQSIHSDSKNDPHYFMGAYIFSSIPPFEIKEISHSPIVGKGFYHGKQYGFYWKRVVAVVPAGFVFDDEHIWVSYGRQDHESWLIKLDKKGLLDSLLPVELEPKKI